MPVRYVDERAYLIGSETELLEVVQLKITKFVQIGDAIRAQIQLASLSRTRSSSPYRRRSGTNQREIFIDDVDDFLNEHLFVQLRVDAESAEFYAKETMGDSDATIRAYLHRRPSLLTAADMFADRNDDCTCNPKQASEAMLLRGERVLSADVPENVVANLRPIGALGTMRD